MIQAKDVHVEEWLSAIPGAAISQLFYCSDRCIPFAWTNIRYLEPDNIFLIFVFEFKVLFRSFIHFR